MRLLIAVLLPIITFRLSSAELIDEFVERSKGFRVSLIREPHQLIAAQVLAYNVLVEETGIVSKSGGFNGSENRETNQRFIDDGSGNRRLVDEFDEVAQWFGIYFGERIIGCSRVFTRRQTDQKMLAELFNSKLPAKYSEINVLEVGRLCGAKEFRSKGLILSLLHKKMVEYAITKDCSLLTYSAQGNVIRILTDVLYEYEGIDAEKYKFIFLPRVRMEESLRVAESKIRRIISGLDEASPDSSPTAGKR